MAYGTEGDVQSLSRGVQGSGSPVSGATIRSSVINLMNTIIGAGILAMPFAFKSNGVLLGLTIIVISGIAASLGLYFQGISSLYLPKGSNASFFSVAKITYPSLAVVFDIAIAIKCFGVGVSYIIIIGDLMPQISESLNFTHEFLLNRQFWVSVAMAVVGPLSFLRKLDSLKYTSVVALVAVGYLVLIVVGHFLVGDTSAARGPIKIVEPESVWAAVSSLPIVVFAFTCHQNVSIRLPVAGGSSRLRSSARLSLTRCFLLSTN
jgi:amino acid permease